MNAAARAINQSNLFSGQLSEMQLSFTVRCILLLLLVLFFSAIGVIYTTNEYRSSFNQLERLQQDNQELHLQYGQLLLEQASLATPSRVEELAIQKLQMRLPVEKDILILQQHED